MSHIKFYDMLVNTYKLVLYLYEYVSQCSFISLYNCVLYDNMNFWLDVIEF